MAVFAESVDIADESFGIVCIAALESEVTPGAGVTAAPGAGVMAAPDALSGVTLPELPAVAGGASWPAAELPDAPVVS